MWCRFEHNYNKECTPETSHALALLYSATKCFPHYIPEYGFLLRDTTIPHSIQLWKEILSLQHGTKIEEAVDLTTKTLPDETPALKKLFALAAFCNHQFTTVPIIHRRKKQTTVQLMMLTKRRFTLQHQKQLGRLKRRFPSSESRMLTATSQSYSSAFCTAVLQQLASTCCSIVLQRNRPKCKSSSPDGSCPKALARDKGHTSVAKVTPVQRGFG